MLEFDDFELETILVHLNFVETVCGCASVRDKLISKIQTYLITED